MVENLILKPVNQQTMDLTKLSKQERFYFDVGEAMSMNNMRSFVNIETMEVEMCPSEDHFFDDEEDNAEDAESNPDKFIPVETASSREAFKVMEDFVDTIADLLMQQRLTDAINGRKPFANFKMRFRFALEATLFTDLGIFCAFWRLAFLISQDSWWPKTG